MPKTQWINKEDIIQIYNLEFPPYIEEFKIGDYVFKRIERYKEAFNDMMHLVNSSGSEFDTKIQTGSHQITATVMIPQKEKKSILPRETKQSTQLDDILFFLTIFTDRNVFKKDRKDTKNIAIIGDHRIHYYGWQLNSSIKYESNRKNKTTWEYKGEEDVKNIPLIHNKYNQVNVWFEKTLNQILQTISSEEWQKKYEGWYFLFLFKSAIQRQIIETSFITSWTIWEHIFAIRNRKWLDNKAIEQMSGDKKISFILNEYFLKSIDDKSRKNIQKLSNTRNRLVHFGQKTKEIDFKEMEMFIRVTEQLMAIILWLSPSNIFNSFEDLDKFLKKKQNTPFCS